MADAAVKDDKSKEMTEEERMAAEWAAMSEDGDGAESGLDAAGFPFAGAQKIDDWHDFSF